MALPDALRTALTERLKSDEIGKFEEGDVTLFISEPKYAFFRVEDDEYQRADVVRDRNPDGDEVMEIYHKVFRTTAKDVKDRVSTETNIEVVPVEVGFGGED